MRNAPPQFSRLEVVRIKSQPPARAYLVGEWGIVTMVERGLVGSGPKAYPLDPLDVPQGMATNIYSVDFYREDQFQFRTVMYCFNEVDLESRGEFDAFSGDEEAAAAGRGEVARAIARNQLYICWCEGLCSHAPGVEQADMPLVQVLPKRVVWHGCRDDQDPVRALAFARVFNQALVKHLLASRADNGQR
jgi:hypothetical protein